MKWKLVLVCLEIVLISKQDRFTVGVERAIGSEISWDEPDCTPDVGEVEARFSPF